MLSQGSKTDENNDKTKGPLITRKYYQGITDVEKKKAIQDYYCDLANKKLVK